jgi:hypothetical protein
VSVSASVSMSSNVRPATLSGLRRDVYGGLGAGRRMLCGRVQRSGSQQPAVHADDGGLRRATGGGCRGDAAQSGQTMGSRAFCEGDELRAPTQLRRFQNRLGARSRLARLWGRFKMAARQPAARRTPPALQHARLASHPVLSAPNSCRGPSHFSCLVHRRQRV